VGVVGLFLFAAVLTGVISPWVHAPTNRSPPTDRLTDISVFFIYIGVDPLFGPNDTQSCAQCPMYLSPGSWTQLVFAVLNTSGAPSALSVDVMLTSNAPVLFQDGASTSTTYDNGTFVPDRVFQFGLDLSMPTEDYWSFSVVAYITVSR